MAAFPVYNILAVPDADVYFHVDAYRAATGKVPTEGDRVTLIFQKEETAREDLTGDSFYPIGLMGTITKVNADGYIVIHTRNRVNLEEVVVFHDHSIDLSITRRPDIEDLNPEEAKERLHALKAKLSGYADKFQWGQVFRAYLSRWESIGQIGCALSPWITNTNSERYEILAEDSQAKRFDLLEKLHYESLELTRMSQEAKSAQEKDYQKLYRESAIKKQIQYLQKELDEMNPENVSDLRKLELRLEDAGLNPEAQKEAKKILGRLRQEGNNSSESGLLLDYLEYMASLPWKKEKTANVSLTEAEKILNEDHFGLEKVKKRILEQLAVMNLRRQQTGSILLFVGAPGTGKTSIGQSIARALSREYVRVSLGGIRDEADIRGHRRTYIGAMAGRILDGIAKAGVNNPVMVLDEIDKLGISFQGDPASALLEVLDPEQNAHFTDHYLNVPFDLSDVFFICTANTVETIPEPLLNRMEVIPFEGYTPLEKFEIAKRHLLPKAMKSAGLKETDLSVTDEALRAVITQYTREAGVRGLKKRMDQICRNAAVEFVKHSEETQEAKTLTVTEEDLTTYLDAQPLPQGLVSEAGRPGVITGLAWTGAGGEVLYIESLFTRGRGKLLITGQLGDVMKESAQLAVSLVKFLYPDKAKLFEKNDLHIHVPDGAIKKDGPSAGITLTCALSSLVTGIPVSPQIAMTGEVSLQGRVKPIGGLPEKLMAAQRAGVKKVLIPKDNERDLREVPKEVLSSLTILPVSDVEEVLTQLGLRRAAPVLRVV
ncbi:MAG: endopeptidase La [Blautia sp.]|nr:endopeptidase La [Blautia sp.]